MNTVVVGVENGKLIVQVVPTSVTPQPAMTLAFYGPDRAMVTDGADRGQSVEFVRAANGSVGWIRVTGRVARRIP